MIAVLFDFLTTSNTLAHGSTLSVKCRASAVELQRAVVTAAVELLRSNELLYAVRGSHELLNVRLNDDALHSRRDNPLHNNPLANRLHTDLLDDDAVTGRSRGSQGDGEQKGE
jgi:hypothetical protein